MTKIDQNKQRVIYRPFKRTKKILDTVTNVTTTTTVVQAPLQNLGQFILGFRIVAPIKDTGEIENIVSFRFTSQTSL